MKTNINMIDGSHNISENIVILADYNLIKSIDCFTLKKYFRWLTTKSGNQNYELNESEFLKMFTIEDILNVNLKNLINTILKK